MIRVVLPYHLRTLARVGSEVKLDLDGPATQRAVLDALEARYPVLRGTIRDHATRRRRPLLRFFACEQDLSDESPDTPLPEAVASGAEPFFVVGAIAGGSYHPAPRRQDAKQTAWRLGAKSSEGKAMLLSREQVRDLDRRAIEEYGVPGVVLMENAGRSTAELLLRLGARGPVVICCGKGNNGGDGYVIARHLDLHGLAVRVLLFAEPGSLEGDAATNCHILVRAGFPITVHTAPSLDLDAVRCELSQAEWVVDALLGTGLRGAVKPPLDRVIEVVNTSGKRILAVDIPSGLDCDTGQPLGPTIRAEHTATFVACKQGFAQSGAAEWLGQVHVLSIGAPRHLLQSYSLAEKI